MDGSIIRILKFSNALLFKPHPNYIPPLRIFTILYDTCSVPSWFKENTPTAFQINYWPLLSHYKQTLFKISIALCPHWLKLEAWWPHVVLTSYSCSVWGSDMPKSVLDHIRLFSHHQHLSFLPPQNPSHHTECSSVPWQQEESNEKLTAHTQKVTSTFSLSLQGNNSHLKFYPCEINIPAVHSPGFRNSYYWTKLRLVSLQCSSPFVYFVLAATWHVGS